MKGSVWKPARRWQPFITPRRRPAGDTSDPSNSLQRLASLATRFTKHSSPLALITRRPWTSSSDDLKVSVSQVLSIIYLYSKIVSVKLILIYITKIVRSEYSFHNYITYIGCTVTVYRTVYMRTKLSYIRT